MEAVERKDFDTAAHMRAVAEIARLIGLEMKLQAQEMDVLLVGALLHDVGKIAVPDIVLKKPVILTPEEHALVRLHLVTGAKILKRIRVLWPIIPAVKHHHERFDGEGYPEGLSSEEIPQAARVIQAADTLDAMTRDRSYQQGITWEEALEEISCKADIQLDPEVVEALLRVEGIAYQRPEPSETKTRPSTTYRRLAMIGAVMVFTMVMMVGFMPAGVIPAVFRQRRCDSHHHHHEASYHSDQHSAALIH